MTDYDAETVMVAFSNGAALTGTPTHPVFVREKGWIAMDALSFADIVNAPFAKINSLPRQRELANAAPVHVLHISVGPRAPVFNLTVEGTHEYYANGILVHNCDAMNLAYYEFGWEAPYAMSVPAYDDRTLGPTADQEWNDQVPQGREKKRRFGH